MELPSYFKEFLTNIRPTMNQRNEMKSGQTTLRERLRNYDGLKGIYISDFLQGSYRRSTAIRPKGDKRSDVDVIVVTSLNEDDYPPKAAMKLFEPFLNEYYKGKWEPQGRSFGIHLSYVDLDLVITSAPSEAEAEKLKSKAVRYIGDVESSPDWFLGPEWMPFEERTSYLSQVDLKQSSGSTTQWKLEPLRIPDRDADEWDDTHPLAQITWTTDKNKSCNTHYINVVKAIKWWKRINEDLPKYPKGYPLEHLVGDCCIDGITSVAEGVTRTLETLVDKYADHARTETVPFLPDHGVPQHNVFHRVSGAEFREFYDAIAEAAETARKALDEQEKSKSVELWRSLLGDKFPQRSSGGTDDNGGGDNSAKSYAAPRRNSSPGDLTFG